MGASERRSILLLGGARHQVPAIETAHRLGLRTVLCDYLPDNPGRLVADSFYLQSTTDRDAVLEIARREGVEGVLSYGTDVAAPTAAYVAERLGLPTNPLDAVRTLSEKHLFRNYLSEHGFPCPRHVVLGTDASPEEVKALSSGMTLPVVLKPTDSSGSKGITVLEDLETSRVARALASTREYSRNGTLVLEEFIRPGFPRVIGGDVFVVDGRVTFWGLMSCLRDESLGGLVPVGERWPSGLDPVTLAKVKDQIQGLVSSLGIRQGEMNVEVLVSEDGTPHFLELAARAGGNLIPSQLSDISGVDLVEANVLFAMGERGDVSFDGVSASGGYATYVLHASTGGTFAGLEVDPALASRVYRTELYVEPGTHVDTLDDASKALGVLFLRFDDVGEMESSLAIMDRLVSVCVEEG